MSLANQIREGQRGGPNLESKSGVPPGIRWALETARVRQATHRITVHPHTGTDSSANGNLLILVLIMVSFANDYVRQRYAVACHSVAIFKMEVRTFENVQVLGADVSPLII